MNKIIEQVKELIGGGSDEWPAGESVPSVWFTAKTRLRDDLFLAIRDRRRSRQPVAPEDEAALAALSAEIERAARHNLALDEVHAARVNREKELGRRKQSRAAEVVSDEF